MKIFTSKPRILLMPDQFGWAHDRKADGIIKYAGHKYDFTKISCQEIKTVKYDDWDLILLFPWFCYDQMPRPIKREKLIGGISSHRVWVGREGDPKDVLGDNFIAITTSSMLLHNIFKDAHPSEYFLPNGVDEELFIDYGRRDFNNDKLVFGWIGKELKHVSKNYFSILEPAMKQVPEVEFKPMLISQRQNSGLGYYGLREMIEYYNSLHVIMCATESEGTPNPALEGGSAGCALLSVPVGNILEFGVPGENWYKADWTVESFVAQVKKIHKDRESLIQNKNNLANIIRSEWSWKNKIQGYIKMFDELLEAR